MYVYKLCLSIFQCKSFISAYLQKVWRHCSAYLLNNQRRHRFQQNLHECKQPAFVAKVTLRHTTLAARLHVTEFCVSKQGVFVAPENNISRRMGNPTICIGENKDADQLRSNCAMPLLSKSVVCSLYPSSVLVQLDLCRTCLKTTLLVFS